MHATPSRRHRPAMHVAFWLAVLLVLTAGRAYPQSSSTILGVVKDTSGAIVPGASVTVQNEDTAQIRTTTTGSDGAYRVPALQAGRYSVRVEKMDSTHTWIADSFSMSHRSWPSILFCRWAPRNSRSP